MRNLTTLSMIVLNTSRVPTCCCPLPSHLSVKDHVVIQTSTFTIHMPIANESIKSFYRLKFSTVISILHQFIFLKMLVTDCQYDTIPIVGIANTDTDMYRPISTSYDLYFSFKLHIIEAVLFK